MEEKELIRRARNSFRAKKSHAEVLSGFQKRGYKLAYAEELIKRAKRPKRIIGIFLISMILFFSLTFSVYTIFSDNKKMNISNPLAGIIIIDDKFVSKSLIETENNFTVDIINKEEVSKTTYNDIEITSEFISFLLNEIGAWKLHKNPLTLQSPVIVFQIEEKEFYSKIGSDIETFDGSYDTPDLKFYINKEDLIDSIMNENSKDIFVKSINEGRTSVDIISNEADLFAKGYFELYNMLNSQSPL